MDKKDLLTISIAIFRHSFGFSFWTKSEPTKLDEKVSHWKKVHDRPASKKTKFAEVQEFVAEKLEEYQKDNPEEKPAKK